MPGMFQGLNKFNVALPCKKAEEPGFELVGKGKYKLENIKANCYLSLVNIY